MVPPEKPSPWKMAWLLTKETFSEWTKDKVPRLGAALSYYTVFSLPPLLIIVIAIGGFFLGADAVRGRILTEFEGLIGSSGAEVVGTMIESASKPASGIIAGILGVATLLLGATGVFVQIQDALNTMWGVESSSVSGILHMIKSRFFSFLSILGMGFLLLVSLVLNAALTSVMGRMGSWLTEELMLAQVATFLISFGMVTVLFALMYKLLPEVKIAWRDVWIGAAVTALLFTIGKFLLGFYLGKSNVTSAYGAAGTTIVIFVWVYYAAQIFLLGAEFTYVYATRCGSRCGTVPAGAPLTAKGDGPPREGARVDPAERRGAQELTWFEG